MKNPTSGRIRSFFAAQTEPLNLAVFRLAVFAWLLRLTYRTDFLGYVHVPADLRVPPTGYGWFFHCIPIEASWVIAVRSVALAACAAGLIGCMARTSAGIACLCSVYLLGLPEFFGKIDHLNHHLVWFTALLAVAPSGDALSIDALRAALRRADRGDTIPPGPSTAYALPLRFVWLLIGVIYFFPGVAKLRAGPEWVLSDNVRYLMYDYWSVKGFVPFVRIDRYPLLCQAVAAATVGFEVLFLPALFFPRLRRLAIAGGVAFHAMTWLYLRILFLSLLLCYTAFIDWSALLGRLGRIVFREPLYLLFDGGRRDCRRLVGCLRSVDVLRSVQYVDTAVASAAHTPGARPSGITIVVGQTSGVRAILRFLARVPLAVAVSPLALLILYAIRQGNDRAAGSAALLRPAPSQRSLTPVAVTGSVLLAINVACGIWQVDSWPFSAYPRFDNIVHSPTRTALDIVVRRTGATEPVATVLPTYTLMRLLHSSDPAQAARRQHAIQELAMRHQLHLLPGESLQFFAVTRSTLPEDSERPPAHSELLWEYRPDAPAADRSVPR